MELVLRQADFGADMSVVIRMLSNLTPALTMLGEDKASTGILGAIGLGRKSILSLRYMIHRENNINIYLLITSYKWVIHLLPVCGSANMLLQSIIYSAKFILTQTKHAFLHILCKSCIRSIVP